LQKGMSPNNEKKRISGQLKWERRFVVGRADKVWKWDPGKKTGKKSLGGSGFLHKKPRSAEVVTKRLGGKKWRNKRFHQRQKSEGRQVIVIKRICWGSGKKPE